MRILRRNSTNRLIVKKLTDKRTGLPVVNASVVASVFQQDGTPVTNAQGVTLVLNAAGLEPAEYEGILLATVQLPDPSYDLVATATNPDGVRVFNETCLVEDG